MMTTTIYGVNPLDFNGCLQAKASMKMNAMNEQKISAAKRPVRVKYISFGNISMGYVTFDVLFILKSLKLCYPINYLIVVSFTEILSGYSTIGKNGKINFHF